VVPDAAIPRGTQWYGFDARTKLDDKVSVGFAYAHSKLDTVSYTDWYGRTAIAYDRSVNTWALNTTYTPAANFTLSAEFARSNADKDNRAYFLAGTYTWDKDSFTVQYNNVQNDAVDQFNSGIGAVAYPFYGLGLTSGDTGYKGFTYVYGHPMSKVASFHIIYMDLKVDGAKGSDKELGAGVVWKF
jgi:hypothetical protein